MADDTLKTLKRINDAAQADMNRDSRQHMRAPFATLDRTGLPEPAELARMERSTWQRFSPRIRRWAKLNELDAQVADLERQQADVERQITEVRELQVGASARDAERLADWQRRGKGDRPVEEVVCLKNQLRDLERDREALRVQVERVLDEKATFVGRHRSKLVSDCDRAVAEARTRYEELSAALLEAREQLVAERLTALWALTFPHETTSRQPALMQSLARGLVARLRRAGVTTGLDVDQLSRLLVEDADALAEAIDPEQQAAVEGRDPDRAGGATWDADVADEQRQKAMREAQERDAAAMATRARRYRQELGLDA